MTAATITKLIAAVITAAKSTYVLSLPAMSVTPRPGLDAGVIALISGLMMLSVNVVTIVAKAAPMTTATARSTTFPRRMKSLNPLSMAVSLGGVSRGGSPLPGQRATPPQPVSQCPAAYSLSRDAPVRVDLQRDRRGRPRPPRGGSAGRSAAQG